MGVEEMVRKIKENIKARSGSEKQNDLLAQADAIAKDFAYINSNWDIQNKSYFIISHRPIIGNALIKGRELVHGEVRRYVDPMIWKQNEFNISVVRILNDTTRRLSEISKRTIEMENTATGRTKSDIEWPGCFMFAGGFRDSREEVKKRKSDFIHYFEGCENVLDIGCGRGEFLELLQEKGIRGYGIDRDGDMVDLCASKGLNAQKADAILYLENAEDSSLDGIILDHVIEHLDPEHTIKLLGLCYKKLGYGRYMLIEVMNPLSLASLTNFYLDMSHNKPVHPETIKFLMESRNFKEIEIKFLFPVADEARLRKIDADLVEKGNRQLIEVYNYNIDMLNNVLYGPQDYVVIGKKQLLSINNEYL